MKLELMDAFRLWLGRKAGEAERGLWMLPDEEMRDWKRRSKGLKDGDELPMPGREAPDGSTLLPGEEMKEPCRRQSVKL